MKNIHARVMVLMHNTLSECALQMYEVSLKYLSDSYQVIEPTRFCDRQTQKQRQGGGNKQARVMVLVHDTSSECA